MKSASLALATTRWLAAAALCLPLGLGCGTRPAQGTNPFGTPSGSSSSAIQGGASDGTLHPFAVGLCGGSPGACQLVCSAALIAPNLVVTARHCVDNVSSTTIDCSLDHFGSQLGPASVFWVTTSPDLLQTNVGWHEAAQIVTPSTTNFCGNDIALLILGDSVAESEATPAMPQVWYSLGDPMHRAAGGISLSEVAIGYGLDSATDTTSAGVRRIRQHTSIACVPGDPMIDCGPVAQSGVDGNEFAAGNGTCEGDSGSSAFEQSHFDQGQWLSLGVLSRGGTMGDLCTSGIYTRLDVWRALILSTAITAAQLGGYAPPSWTTPPSGVLPDGGSAGDGASPGSLGMPCAGNGVCDSNLCVSPNNDNSYVCSTACSTYIPCPPTMVCDQGYCFFGAADAGSAVLPSKQHSSTGGCGLGGGHMGEADAWPIAALVGLVAAIRRRRRPAAARGPA